ncbi:MAG: NADPH-dependent F420 reductase [Chloroflexi bacterium]|nr:NADPH-dependent F420 reductase [Chloroflexota bacterium]
MIGFIGGTGPEGRGLALRFALAGERITVGSRELARAEEAVRRITARVAIATDVLATTNAQVAQVADMVFLTVPYEAQAGLLEMLAPALAGKVVVSTIAPLAFENGRATIVAVPEGSASAQAQWLLPQSQVVAAFQNVSAVDLWDPHRIIEGDVVVCSDHEEAKQQVMSLAQRIPNLRAVDGGGLASARYVEGVTALLLNINRTYRARAMVRIVGLESRQT